MKKRNRLLVLLALLLTVVVSMTALFACVDPNVDDDESEQTMETRDQLLSNGTFYNATSSTSTERYLKDTLQSWTKSSGAIGYSSAVMGAIDVTKLRENYNLVWDDSEFEAAVAGPDGNGIGLAPNTPDEKDENGNVVKQDNYAAVIASTDKQASVYYASSSAKIEKNKYYKLSIDVWTFLKTRSGEVGEGAYLFVTDGVYAEWAAIDTKRLWETRTLYIEGNNFEDRSFSVQLWLGHGPAKIGSDENPRLTEGVALFDNVILNEISKEDYEGAEFDGKKVEADVNTVGNAKVKKTSLLFPDPEFDYNRAIASGSTSGTTTKPYYSARVGAPYNYTQIVGQTDLTSDKPWNSSQGNSAPYGIFDLSKLYSYEKGEEGKDDVWTDTFAKFNATEFAAPDRKDFYKADGTFDNNARKDAQSDYVLNDTRALLIYNYVPTGIGYKSDKKLLIETGKYYKVSVYVYVYKALNLPNAIVDKDGNAAKLTAEQVAANEQAVASYNANHPKAQVKLTGASLKDADELHAYADVGAWKGDTVAAVRSDEIMKEENGEQKGTGTYTMTVSYTENNVEEVGEDATGAREGYWTEVAFYVKGNALSDRKVNVEFWVGEGTASSETLVEGGAIFDSLSIVSSDNAAEIPGVPDQNPETAFEELSPFLFEQGNDFADLTNTVENGKVTEIKKNQKPDPATGAENTNREKDFTLEFADGINSMDDALKAYVVGAKADKTKEDFLSATEGLDPDDFQEWLVERDGANANFNTLLLRNLGYTASLLTVNRTAPIRANNYYRLSMWVKTVGIDKGQGATINLLLRNEESDYETANVLSSFTAVNTDGEWVEYVFYISGNYVERKHAADGEILDFNAVTVQFVLGAGDSYNPSTHVKGDVIVAALNVQGEITYSEYNSASSGDTLKKYAFTSNVSTENTVSGGRFNTVDYDATVKAYNEKNLDREEADQLTPYDADGYLSGVGKPTTTAWSQTSPVSNQLDSPKSFGVTNDKLTWTGVKNARKYELFFVNKITGKTVKIGETDNADEDSEKEGIQKSFARPFVTAGTFYVNAVPEDQKSLRISNRASLTTSTEGSPTEAKSFAEWYEANKVSIPAEEKDYEANFGIIDYRHLSARNYAEIIKNGNTGLPSDLTNAGNTGFRDTLYSHGDYYGAADPNEIRTFFGEGGILPNLYDNVMMLSSPFHTRGGYTMYSSTSLTSESYYEISVWVKTLGEATASFTIDNSTNTFYNTSGTDYIGFNNVKTNGEWVQLKLYARTGLSSATFKLKLFMGDPYVKDYKDGEGLCSGTVFFDDIAMKKLADKDAYDKLQEGKSEFRADGTFFAEIDGKTVVNAGDNVYTDLEYERNAYAFKTLEFSIDSFDVTTESTTTATGAKPDDYSQTVLGESTTVSDAHQAKVAYGVFDVTELTEDKHSYLYENFQEDGVQSAWFGLNDIESLKAYMQGFGNNVLAMANFIDNGMYYKSSAKSIKASSYYQISFYAKLKAPEGKYAEMRFYHGDDTTKYEGVMIKPGEGEEEHGFKKYTVYVQNATTSSISSNYITFNLGTKEDVDGETVTDYTKGLLVIDNVEIREIEESVYEEAKTAAKYEEWSDDEKKTSAELVNFTKFSPKSTETPPEEESEGGGWDSATWLIFSTSLIGVMIVVAVAVVLIRRFRKKHVKARAPEIESNVKVDGYVAEKKESKKDADRREFDD